MSRHLPCPICGHSLPKHSKREKKKCKLKLKKSVMKDKK